MPFKEQKRLQQVYKLSIEPAVNDAGFECVRSDRISKAGLVLEDIVKEAYHADVVIADITGNNVNVLYELGLSHGLAKPVIMLSQRAHDAPFDLRTYRIVKYTTTYGADSKLREDIKSALEATLHSAEAETRSNPVRLFLPAAITATQAVAMRQKIKDLEDENKQLEGKSTFAHSLVETLGRLQPLIEVLTAHLQSPEGTEATSRDGSRTIDLPALNEGRNRIDFKKLAQK